MGTQPLDYAAIIADLEAKKAAIEATIATLRSAMALGTLGAGQGGDVPVAGGPAPSIYGSEVPAGAFLGKSIPEAARLYLEIVKKKQTSREIGEALQKGGIESTSSNFISLVHAVLDRARKSPNSAIVKLGTQWGLAGWYPKGILNNVAAATPTKKKGKKSPKKSKKADAAQEPANAAPSTPPALPPGKAIDRALAFVQSKPDGEFSLNEVAQHLGMGDKGARLILGKLVKGGKLRMSAPGTYTSSAFAGDAQSVTTH